VPYSMEKITHESLEDKAYRIIKNMILEREVAPGDRLKIADLAQALDVSRSLVRNSLAMLAKDGLVEFFRRGIFVKQVTRKEMQDLYELRKLIESFALQKGLEAMNDDEIAAIREQYEKAAEELNKNSLKGCYQLDISLHQLLVDSSRNSHLIKMFSTCQALMKLVILSDFNRTMNVEQSLEEHRQIIEALDRRDLAAASLALTSHLDESERRVLDIFPQ
jgi:DNA-binding GntR family transcriptional regulator